MPASIGIRNHQIVPHTSPALELGRVASLNGQWRDAFTWLSTAREFTLQQGGRPYAALAAYELALAHQRRNERDDLVQAQRYFQEALQLFEELGMPWYRDEARRCLEALQRPRRVGGLTARETEVLRLVAQGQTNRAIAETLVSTHTSPLTLICPRRESW